MFKQNLPRTMLAAMIITTLTACGGSGGGENGNGGGNVPAPSINLTNTIIDLPEAGDADISFTLANAGAAAIVSAESNNSSVSVDLTGTTLNITTAEVDNNTPVEITLKVKFGGQSGTSTLSVNVLNNSIVSAYQKTEALINAMALNYIDEKQLFSFASQVGYTSGIITRSERDRLTNTFSDAVTQVSNGATITEAITVLIDDYEAATITETAYRNGLDELTTKYNSSLIAPNAVVNELLTAIGSPFSDMTLSGMQFDLDSLTYSQIINRDIALFDGQSWQFNDNFAFLQDVLPSFNLTQLCLATDRDA